jgi:hypothetical protein
MRSEISVRDRTWSAIDQYFKGELIPSDPAFHALLEASARANEIQFYC